MFRHLLVLALVLVSHAASAETIDFGQGRWPSEEWVSVKSARFPAVGKWLQAEDHLYNRVPADATPEEMLSKRAAETHAALVRKTKVDGDFVVTLTTSFDHRMAPALLLTSQLYDTDQGAEYRNHVQVVLFDQGINVWQGAWNGEKFSWTKAGYARFPLEPKRIYTLKVKKTAKSIEVQVDEGSAFGFATDAFEPKMHVGIIGCEGVNRFYRMNVEAGG